MAYQTISAPAEGTALPVDDLGVNGLMPRSKLAWGVEGVGVDVSAADPLPVTISGASTAANQATIIGHLDGVESALTAIAGHVDGLEAALAGTLTVSMAGVATAANQATAITHLAAIEAAAEAGATEVTLSALSAKLPTSLGAKTVAASLSIAPATNASFAVTGTFWQATQPVSLASAPLPTGAATAANQATGNTSLAAIEAAVEGTLAVSVASLPLPTGAATEATLDAVSDKLPASLGPKAASASLSVAPASDGFAVRPEGRHHETVAASQTDQMLGATGAAGDILDGLLIVPATTSPGAVSIEYGATNIIIFAGGASSVSNLIPFWAELGGIASVGGGWEVTTGANVSVIAVGRFT